MNQLRQQLKDRTERQQREADDLVLELPPHLATKPRNNVLYRVEGDLHVLQRARGPIGLEHDVRSGQYLKHDSGLVHGLGVYR
jgi:hypothetical protein